MKTSELLKQLRENGCQMARHGSSHDIWESPLTGKRFPVPRHKTEVKTGTAEKILRDAGIKGANST